MDIIINVAEAHKSQLRDSDIAHEIESVQDYISNFQGVFPENQICFMFIKGYYNHQERAMRSACLFVNRLSAPIKELHGEVRLRFTDRDGIIAKMTVDFNEEFMGTLESNHALLVHVGIPVKGLKEDSVVNSSEVSGDFDSIRVTFV